MDPPAFERQIEVKRPASPSDAGLADLRELVWRANLDLVRHGLVALSFGNASGIDRARGLIVIKPSGVPYDELRPESLAVISLEDGRLVEGRLKPSSDAPTHLLLYQRYAGIGGIVHTHSKAATAWAQAGLPIPPFGTTHADHFRGPVPVTRPMTDVEVGGDYERETGSVIAETLDELELTPEEMPAVLVSSHGPFTWGRDVSAAVENAVALETVAEMAFRTVALNRDANLVAAFLLDRHFSRKHGPKAYYGQSDE